MAKSDLSGKSPQKKQVSLDERYFRLPNTIPASRCRDCKEVFYPGGKFRCSKCTSANMEDIVLTPKGKLDTFTVITMAPPGAVLAPPYALGMVITPEGAHITAVLTETNPAKLKLGMPVEMVVEKLKQDEQGNDVMVYKFKPV